VAPIAKGGSGEVWKAIGPGGFPAALKVIPLTDREVVAELRSLELLRDIRHANLVTVFGAWQTRGALIVAMELADGSLWDRYREARDAGLPGIPISELIGYLDDAAKAIDFLNDPRHALPGGERVGVLHRDIKPHNLLLFGNCVKLADFGLAQVMGAHAPTDKVQATLAYACPECFHGLSSIRSDQYSLAVTYCQLRSGRLLFTGSVWQIMLAHSLDTPDLSMLPEEEGPVVARGLAKNPNDRWPDCRTFVGALANCGRTHNRPDTVAPRTPHRHLTGRRLALASFFAITSFLAASKLQEYSRPPTPVPAGAKVKPGLARCVLLAEADEVVTTTRTTVSVVIADTVAASTAKIESATCQLTEPCPVALEKDPGHAVQEPFAPVDEDIGPATASLPESTSRDNPVIMASFERGKEAARRRDHDQAIADFSEAIRLDPGRASAFAERGHAHVWKGDYNEALADYAEALRLDSRQADVFYGLGLAYYSLAKYTRAVASYSDALELNADDALALNGRGLALLAQGQRERAVVDFTAALHADAAYAEAYNNRGCVYCQQGKWDQAATDFTQAVRLDRTNAAYERNRVFAVTRKAGTVLIRGVPSPSGANQRSR
jgi:tetratricopeptide (TPR) repeat protein